MRALIAALAALLACACVNEPTQRTAGDRAGPPRVESGRPFPHSGRAAPTDTVILLPGADGKTGSIVVRQGGKETVLGSAYALTRSARDRVLEMGQANEGLVKKDFAEALTAIPPPPLTFVVLFRVGVDELTEESKKELTPMLEQIGRRPAPEITLVGHADLLGPDRVNDPLSLRRAERVRRLLMQSGVPDSQIAVAARGEHEPVVQTADGVREPRNRRVEISVR